jgi:hypothetical protein
MTRAFGPTPLLDYATTVLNSSNTLTKTIQLFYRFTGRSRKPWASILT